jgi:hypothetical protein
MRRHTGRRWSDRRLIDEADAWDYYPPDPLARRIHHVIAETLLASGSGFEGLDNVASSPDGRSSCSAITCHTRTRTCSRFCCIDSGQPQVAERPDGHRGPKVYVSRTRRFSSSVSGTVRTPQNSGWPATRR